MVADLTQRGVIKSGAALPDLAPNSTTTSSVELRPALKARDAPTQNRSPKRENVAPAQNAPSTAPKNSAPKIDGVLGDEAEQLPMPEEVPLPDNSLNELQARVAEFISRRYRQYPLPFSASDAAHIPRSMVQPAAHAGESIDRSLCWH